MHRQINTVFETRTLHSEDGTIELTVVYDNGRTSGMSLDLKHQGILIDNENYIKYTIYPALYEAVIGTCYLESMKTPELEDLTVAELRQLCEIMIRADAMGWMDHIKY